MAGGPLRIDSRPSRWSVTRLKRNESWGKSWRGTDILSLFLSQVEDWSTENIGQRKRTRGQEEGRGGWRKGARKRGGGGGRRVVERWKVEKRRQ